MSPADRIAAIEARLKKAAANRGPAKLDLLPRDAERLWAGLDRSTDGSCWLWRGRVCAGGYGVVTVGSRTQRVHRVVFEHLVGLIPSGLELDHLCRVRRCANPAHLEPVTRLENVRRGLVNQHKGKTHCRLGHEFTPENTRLNSGGGRVCRTCERARWRRRATEEPASTQKRSAELTERDRFLATLRLMHKVADDRGLQAVAELLRWFIDGDETQPLTYDAELGEAWAQVVRGEDVRHLPECPAFKGGPMCGPWCKE